jgi:hypothetical protein
MWQNPGSHERTFSKVESPEGGVGWGLPILCREYSHKLLLSAEDKIPVLEPKKNIIFMSHNDIVFKRSLLDRGGLLAQL